VEYFSSIGHPCPTNFNPADYLIDLITMHSAQMTSSLARSYLASPHYQYYQQLLKQEQYQNSISEPDPGDARSTHDDEYASSWLLQVYTLSSRTLVNNLRNPYLLKTQYVLIIALAVFIGTIYWHVGHDVAGVQDRAGCMFFLLSLLSFGSMSSIDLFFQERALFARERANGMYRTSSYFVSKLVCDFIPMRIVPPILLGSITYYMVGLNPSLSAFLYFLLILVLVSMAASSMCVVISAFTPSLSFGNLLAILLLLFCMLFGGFLVNKQTMPWFVGWLKWLSFLNYSFEVVMVNELSDLDIQIDYQGSIHDFNGRQIGQMFFDMDPDRFAQDLWILGGMVLAFLTAAYVFLRTAVQEKR